MYTETGSDGTVQSGFPVSPGDRDCVCPGARNAACVILTGIILCTSGAVVPAYTGLGPEDSGLMKKTSNNPQSVHAFSTICPDFSILPHSLKGFMILKTFSIPLKQSQHFLK